MKFLIVLFLITFYSCEDKGQKSQVSTPPQQNSSEAGSIVEENDACICTKDWRPVCGENGVTYPNACQAKCEKVESFTEGTCQK